MSEDLENLINKNPCGMCRASGLSFCKCAGSSGGGGDDDEDAKNSRKNPYKTEFESDSSPQNENKFELVEFEPNKSTFAFETDQQEKVALHPTPFHIKPAPTPPVKKDDNKQQEENKTENEEASTENKSLNPTPFSMTLGLDR